MKYITLNVSNEFIVLIITNFLNLFATIITFTDYRKYKQRTLYYFLQTWFWFFCQNFAQALSYLLLDSRIFILYKFLTIPTVFFLILSSDSLVRYEINPWKMVVFGVYSGGLFSCVFDPSTIELIQFADGTYSWNSAGLLYYWTILLIFTQSYMFLHQTFKIYIHAPTTLRGKSFGIVVGGFLISVVSLVFYVLSLNSVIPAITISTMSLGVIIIAFLIHREPKLVNVLKLISTDIETKYLSNLKQKLTETETKLDERNKQLLRTQKMESMGSLASGMAHDFNNVLQAIRSNTELLFSDPKVTEDQKDLLTEIGQACENGANISRQILSFSRRSDDTFKPLDIIIEITAIVDLCRRTFPKNIQFIINPLSVPAIIIGNKTQIHQIIMNLSINARDVMPQGGYITITAKKVELSSEECTSLPPLKPGAHVEISVKDNGPGMPSENLNHLFEPFYTTKAEGKGTGLGLFIIYNIVQNHKGFIHCNSEKGKGTEFKILFPLVSQKI